MWLYHTKPYYSQDIFILESHKAKGADTFIPILQLIPPLCPYFPAFILISNAYAANIQRNPAVLLNRAVGTQEQ